MSLATRLQLYWPYWRRFGWRGKSIAQTLFPKAVPSTSTLGTVQLAQFDAPLHFRYGTTDTNVFCQIFLENIYRLRLSIAPKTIIDAGANVGFSSLFFHHQYPAAELVALEAETSNFKLLQNNVQSYPRIHPLQAAIWYEDGNLKLTNQETSHSSFQFRKESTGKEQVAALSPLTIMKQRNWSAIDLFKINIEGGEKELFGNGPGEWIPKVGVFILDLHDRFRPGCTEAVEKALAPWHFRHQPLGDLHLFLRP